MAQVVFVVETILRNREDGTALKEQAVLFRTSHHSAMLEIELARRNIPFVKFGGLKFVEAAHVKDVLAVLRWAENPADRVTGFRVVQLLDGIGPATAGKLFEHMRAAPSSRRSPAFRAAGEGCLGLARPRRADARAATARRPIGRHSSIACGSGTSRICEQRYADAVVRAGDLDQLQRIAAGYPTRCPFLTDLTLDPPSATCDEAGPPLARRGLPDPLHHPFGQGQEWKAVFVLNVVDGCIPSDMSTGNAEEIEEERRLLYVAMTRAKDQLALIVPHRFYVHGQSRHGDKHLYASRTRFIPAGIIEQFEVRAWPPARRDTAPSQAGSASTVDLAARLRGMWRRAG